MKKGRLGLDIFEWARQRSASTSTPERRPSFKECLADAISGSPYSREQIADRMSLTLGTAITKAQLDAWTAESKGSHRFPAEYLPAFCTACGSISPLEYLARAAGYHLVDKQERMLAQVARLQSEEKRLRSQRKLLEQLVEDSDD